MNKLQRNMIISAVLLSLFAISGTAFVALTESATKARIAENRRQAILKNLNKLIPDDQHDNDLLADTIEMNDKLLGSNEPVTVYLARKNNMPVAALYTVIAPDGYSGKIWILMGVKENGTLAGIHIISHRETPGLGDAIDAEKSKWDQQFSNKSLTQPADIKWKVKKDGGSFDQLTGATITPRAVVKAIHNGLLFFEKNHAKLFVTNDKVQEK